MSVSGPADVQVRVLGRDACSDPRPGLCDGDLAVAGGTMQYMGGGACGCGDTCVCSYVAIQPLTWLAYAYFYCFVLIPFFYGFTEIRRYGQKEKGKT